MSAHCRVVPLLTSAGAIQIRTHYEFPPIPIRDFDWMAVEDDYEPGMPIGYGRTEEEAIADLKELLEDRS